MSNIFDRKMREVENNIAPGNWKITKQRVYRETPIYNRDKTEILDYKTEVASPIPVFPSAILINDDTKTEKLEITFMKHNRWRSFISDRSVTANRNSIIRLADRGLEVNSDNSGTLVRYLADVVAGSLFCLPRKTAKSVMGWVGAEFMPYTDKIVFDGEEQFMSLYQAIRTRGKLSDWVEYVRSLRDNMVVRLTMAASFASPLIELIGENPFVIHLWGGTGTAKTVAMFVAMSIWGDPSMGKMTRTMNMTTNSMLTTAAFLKNLPFAGDELQTIKSAWQNYDKLIMCITEGIDRGRMSYDKVNETKSWKCSFLFTGEEPCTKQESGGGVKNRVIEIEVKGKIIEDGNATVQFVRSHYGAAGREFIEFLQGNVNGAGSTDNADAEKIEEAAQEEAVPEKQRNTPPEDIDTHAEPAAAQTIRALYKAYFKALLDAADTTDKQAGAMAIILTADKLSSTLFWPDEAELTVEDVKEYLCITKEVDVTERAYQFVLNAIAENIANFESDSKLCWGKISGEYAYINTNVLNRLMKSEGFDFDAVKRKWADKGYLVRDKRGQYAAQTRVGGVRAQCVQILMQSETTSPHYETELKVLKPGEPLPF